MALTEEKIKEIQDQLKGLPQEEQQKKLQEILAQLPPEEREELVGGQCPFCLMAEGKIEVRKVYEDDKCMAVLDINPANTGHAILFPKKHYPVLSQVDDKEVGHLFSIANKVATAIFEVVGAQGTNIIVSNGAAAGQRSPHLLINIIPRFTGDKVSIGWQPSKVSDEDMASIAAKASEKVKSLVKKDEAKPIKIEASKSKKVHRIA